MALNMLSTVAASAVMFNAIGNWECLRGFFADQHSGHYAIMELVYHLNEFGGAAKLRLDAPQALLPDIISKAFMRSTSWFITKVMSVVS